MVVEISVPWAPVKALAHLAAKADVRPWVVGVWLDSSGPTLRVMATSGAVLGVYATETPATEAPPVFLPLHIVEACNKSGFSHDVRIVIDATGHAMAECFGTHHYWQDPKHEPVEYRRVIPRQCSGVAQQFDAELLAPFLKVRKALGKKPIPAAVRLSHNGLAATAGVPSSVLVTLADVPEFVGVLMPLRGGESEDPFAMAPREAPTWVFERAVASAPQGAGAEDLV